MASIRTSDSATIEEASGACKLCLKERARYTCPRCNAAYCSSDCYKCRAHASCSEAFYKDCFMEGLKDLKSGEDDKRKIIEMLQKLEQESPPLDSDDDDCDEGDESDLAERLAGIDLDRDTDKIWTRLTDKEKEDFQCMVRDGRLGTLIEQWDPWWNVKPNLVEEVTEQSCTSSPSPHPAILTTIPEFSKLLARGTPSVTIKFSIINVLCGYAYIMRLHNGDAPDGKVKSECAEELRLISSAIDCGNYSDTSQALQAVFQSLQEVKSLFTSQAFTTGVLQDVVKILLGQGRGNPLLFTMAALSDVHTWFAEARKNAASELKSITSDTELKDKLASDKRTFYSMQKKVEFYISWTHKFGLCLQCLVPEVELEFCRLSSELTSHQHQQRELETSWGGRKQPPRMLRFIEEVADR